MNLEQNKLIELKILAMYQLTRCPFSAIFKNFSTGLFTQLGYNLNIKCLLP